MASTATHDAWAERIEEFEAKMAGRGFVWSPVGDTGQTVLAAPDGRIIGTVLLTDAQAVCAALNTPEGRTTYAREVIS